MSISSSGSVVLVSLDRIPAEAGAQARVKIRTDVVRHYAVAMTQQQAEGGVRFPPVVLFTDGQAYWLADGWHRVLAARRAGLTEIAADVRPGTARDALLHSVSANSAHSLPRTNADKRRAVALLLADSEWSQWSDREIGRHCQIDHKVVGTMRRRASGEKPQIEKRKVRRGDTVYEMTVAADTGIGWEAAVATPVIGPTDALAVADTTVAADTVVGDQAAVTTVPTPPTDALGIAVPPQRAQVFASSADFREAYDLLARLAKVVDRIGRSPAGEVYRKELVAAVENGQPVLCCPALRIALRKLQDAEPYCSYCPECQQHRPGSTDPRCRKCAGRGWTTRPIFHACPDSYRRELTRRAS
jgi:hypothetical protein